MKNTHFPLILIVTLLFALTISQNATAILNAGSSSCDEHGKADFQLSYYGNKVIFENAKITVLKRSSNETYDVAGDWNLDSIKFTSNDTEQAFPRFSSKQNFTSKGTYAVTFLIGKEKATFIITCPGIPCRENRDCSNSEFCSPDEVCESLSCTACEFPTSHSCMQKCNDNNICTQDTCNAGVCENEYISKCCFTDKNCNDGLMCTKDSCKNYRCAYEEVTCQKKLDCSIPICKEFIGCTNEMNQTCVKEKNKIYSFFESSIFGKILKFMHLI